MTYRLSCLVPGCRRTTAAAAYPEWICQRHWSALPKAQRRIYSRAKRKHKGGAVLSRLWRLLSKRAVEAAFFDRGF